MIVLYRDLDGVIVFEQKPNITPSRLDPAVREKFDNQFCLDCRTAGVMNQHGCCEVCGSIAIA